MKRRELLLKFGVPTLLTTVAIVQEFFSRKFHLSPWKGGGFGMFSTVDAPSARFLRIYLVSQQGKTQVRLPSWLGNLATEVRTIPTEKRILHLARELAQSNWINDTSARSVSSITKTNEGDSSSNYFSDFTSETPSLINHQSEIKLGMQQLTQLLPPKVLGKGKLLPKGAEIVNFQEVEVEVWQYKFNPELNQVKAHKIASSVVKRLS